MEFLDRGDIGDVGDLGDVGDVGDFGDALLLIALETRLRWC